MNNALLITIEEWAGDNGISVNDEQVIELAEAIEICSEVEIGSRGFTLGCNIKSEKDIQIDDLKNQIQTLEKFIRGKGLVITHGSGYVTEHTMERISSSHSASNDKTTYY